MVNSEMLNNLPVSPCLRIFFEILLSEADEFGSENSSLGVTLSSQSSPRQLLDPTIRILNPMKSYEVGSRRTELHLNF